MLEGESLKATASFAKIKTQVMSAFHDGRWSGNNHLWWPDTKPGEKATITFPVSAAGKYDVTAVFTKAHDYGIFRLLVDGKPAIDSLDLYDRLVTNTAPISLGVFDLAAGDHTLTVEVLGANEKAGKRYMFGLDYLKLNPVK